MIEVGFRALLQQRHGVAIHFPERLHLVVIARVEHGPIRFARVLKPVATTPPAPVGAELLQDAFFVHKAIHREQRAIELDRVGSTRGPGLNPALKRVGAAHGLGLLRALRKNPTAVPKILPPLFMRRARLGSGDLFVGGAEGLELRDPHGGLGRLRGERVDANIEGLHRCGGGKSPVILRDQSLAGDQSAKGQIQERIAEFLHRMAQMLFFQSVGKNALGVAVIPTDRVVLRRQNRVAAKGLGSSLRVGFCFIRVLRWTIGVGLLQPMLQSDLRSERLGALDLDIHHRAVGIDPEVHRGFVLPHPGFHHDAATGQIEFLTERATVADERLVEPDAHAAELEEFLIAIPRIAFGEVENQIASRLDPEIRGEVTVANRHRAVHIRAGRVPHDIVGRELFEHRGCIRTRRRGCREEGEDRGSDPKRSLR